MWCTCGNEWFIISVTDYTGDNCLECGSLGFISSKEAVVAALNLDIEIVWEDEDPPY